jgi:hypothetical protein
VGVVEAAPIRRQGRAPRLRLPARATNLLLLGALLLAFATGAAAVATGSARGRWVVITYCLRWKIAVGTWKSSGSICVTVK